MKTMSFLVENTLTMEQVFEVDEKTFEPVRVLYIYGRVWEFLELNLISDEIYAGHEDDLLEISSDGKVRFVERFFNPEIGYFVYVPISKGE